MTTTTTTETLALTNTIIEIATNWGISTRTPALRAAALVIERAYWDLADARADVASIAADAQHAAERLLDLVESNGNLGTTNDLAVEARRLDEAMVQHAKSVETIRQMIYVVSMMTVDKDYKAACRKELTEAVLG